VLFGPKRSTTLGFQNFTIVVAVRADRAPESVYADAMWPVLFCDHASTAFHVRSVERCGWGKVWEDGRHCSSKGGPQATGVY